MTSIFSVSCSTKTFFSFFKYILPPYSELHFCQLYISLADSSLDETLLKFYLSFQSCTAGEFKHGCDCVVARNRDKPLWKSNASSATFPTVHISHPPLQVVNHIYNQQGHPKTILQAFQISLNVLCNPLGFSIIKAMEKHNNKSRTLHSCSPQQYSFPESRATCSQKAAHSNCSHPVCSNFQKRRQQLVPDNKSLTILKSELLRKLRQTHPAFFKKLFGSRYFSPQNCLGSCSRD